MALHTDPYLPQLVSPFPVHKRPLPRGHSDTETSLKSCVSLWKRLLFGYLACLKPTRVSCEDGWPRDLGGETGTAEALPCFALLLVALMKFRRRLLPSRQTSHSSLAASHSHNTPDGEPPTYFAVVLHTHKVLGHVVP